MAPHDLEKAPFPDLKNNQEVYEPKSIKTYINTAKGRQYLVKWKGWPVNYNIWEPEEYLKNARQILQDYQKCHKHTKWDEVNG